MSLFGDLDIASASDDPFGIPAGTYPCIISDAKAGRNKDDNKTGLTIFYKITEGEPAGNTAQEWKTIQSDGDTDPKSDANKKNASYIKMRLRELGIPEDRMNTVEPNDLKGIEGYVTMGEPNNGFPRVVSFSLTKPGVTAGADSTQAAVADNPFSPSV